MIPEMNKAITLWVFTILSFLQVNGMTFIILIINVAGAHTGAVKRSAIAPPSPPAIMAYGAGRMEAAR